MIKIKLPLINLDDTFDCGQCFRWQKADGGWVGVVGGRVAKVTKNGEYIQIISNDEDTKAWEEYFDAERDYQEILGIEYANEVIEVAKEKAKGIRILKQPLWEVLISFIISQNNNIPRIKKIINLLCENFGDKIDFEGNIYYSFPTAFQLAGKDLSIIKAGFRDKYIKDAIQKFNDKISTKEELLEIKGIGEKVADCIRLFAFNDLSSFPLDVWTKRIVGELNLDMGKLGLYAGVVQQWLYHYYRNIKNQEAQKVG